MTEVIVEVIVVPEDGTTDEASLVEAFDELSVRGQYVVYEVTVL